MLEGPDNESRVGRARSLFLACKVMWLNEYIPVILGKQGGKKGCFTGSCLFLQELMRCQEDFSMPVPVLYGLGSLRNTLLSVKEVFESFEKASSSPVWTA